MEDEIHTSDAFKLSVVDVISMMMDVVAGTLTMGAKTT